MQILDNINNTVRDDLKKIVHRKNAFKVGSYYHTDWMEEESLPLKIDGLNIDTIYDNFVRQIAGDALQADKSESLKEICRERNASTKLAEANCSSGSKNKKREAAQPSDENER